MKKNSGFSLVELMVAMVIGLMIVLGAGQLFLTVFQTNRQVESLSEKQAAVNFAVEVLLRDIRRAVADYEPLDDGVKLVVWNGSELALAVANRSDVSNPICGVGDIVTKKYSLDVPSGSDEGFLNVSMSCNEVDILSENVVGGFVADNGATTPGFDVDNSGWSDGILKITFRLISSDNSGDPDTLTFFSVNRTEAVTN